MWSPLRSLLRGLRPAHTQAGPPDPPSEAVSRAPAQPKSAAPAEPEPTPSQAGGMPAEAIRGPLPTLVCEPELAIPPDTDLDRSYFLRLLALETCRDGGMSASEAAIIRRLDELTHLQGDQGLLPRLPAVLPKLMGLVRRDDVSARDLAEHLSRDPVLVGEVIRLANSPRYRTSRDITSLQEAVVVLGQRGMHQLVTNVAMRPVFNTQQGRFSHAAGSLLWGQAERCAHACAYLQSAAADQFEAYLAGMSANAGLIAALRVLDQNYHDPLPPQTTGFKDALFVVAAKLSTHITKEWRFPDEVVTALEARTAALPMPTASTLGAALHTAERVSKWHLLAPGLCCPARPGLEDRVYQELERAFGEPKA